MIKHGIVSLLLLSVFSISFSKAYGLVPNKPDPIGYVEEESIISDIRNIFDSYLEDEVSIERLTVYGSDILRGFSVELENDKLFFVKIVQSDDNSRYIDKLNKLDKLICESGIKGKLTQLNAKIVMPVHKELYLTTESHYEILIFPFVQGKTLHDITLSKLSFLSHYKEIEDAFYRYGQVMAVITHNPVSINDEHEPLRLSTPDRHWENVIYSNDTQEFFVIDFVMQNHPVLTNDTLTEIYRQLHWSSLFKLYPYTNAKVAIESYQKGYKENLDLTYGLDTDTIDHYWIDKLNEKRRDPGVLERFTDWLVDILPALKDGEDVNEAP